MMDSIYHILKKPPKIYADEISCEYEELAQSLYHSDRLRVDTGYYSNFVRFTDNKYGISLSFGNKELSRVDLLDRSRVIIKRLYQRYNINISGKQIESILQNLIDKSKRLLLPPEELMLQLARIFVQSAHPIVIRWMLIDKVEVFITYSYSIGDTMNVRDWKYNGKNSGMQSTDGQHAVIYVSCGGDPFAKNHHEYPQYGDGWAAVARLQIIAAQEIGHYADIVRAPDGRQITRHSANFSCTKAKENVAKARLDDIKRCNELFKDLLDNGLSQLIETETKLKFYDKQKISAFRVWWLRFIARRQKKELLNYAINQKMTFIHFFFKQEKYVGLMIRAMIYDMLSHLSPAGDVYQHKDPDVHEAIACAESLARVPQQVMKWGHLITHATMRDLYLIYYKQVILSLIENYEQLTGTKFTRQQNKTAKCCGITRKIINLITGIFKDKKFRFQEVRGE